MNACIKMVGMTVVAIVATAAPVSFRPQNVLSGGPMFRLQEACGQATECRQDSYYICSTVREDHKGYKCSEGCKSSFTDMEGFEPQT